AGLPLRHRVPTRAAVAGARGGVPRPAAAARRRLRGRARRAGRAGVRPVQRAVRGPRVPASRRRAGAARGRAVDGTARSASGGGPVMPGGTTRFAGLWRHADFLKLWAGQTVSVFGDQIGLLALPLLAVLTLQANAAQM